MSLPANQYWFSTTVRRNRKSFFFATVLLMVVLLVLALLIGGLFLFEIASPLLFSISGLMNMSIYFLLFIPFVICKYLLTAQRLRDMNLTGWLALLWIPIDSMDPYLGGAISLVLFIALVAVPGTSGGNNYGPDPLMDYYR